MKGSPMASFGLDRGRNILSKGKLLSSQVSRRRLKILPFAGLKVDPTDDFGGDSRQPGDIGRTER
jgi:hypothetical protein